MFEAQGTVFTTRDEIKILTRLKILNGVSFKVIHIHDISYYGLLAIIRGYEKQGFTTNIGGILNITERGLEYLNKLSNSSQDSRYS